LKVALIIQTLCHTDQTPPTETSDTCTG
jgi:hypothetical protein